MIHLYGRFIHLRTCCLVLICAEIAAAALRPGITVVVLSVTAAISEVADSCCCIGREGVGSYRSRRNAVA